MRVKGAGDNEYAVEVQRKGSVEPVMRNIMDQPKIQKGQWIKVNETGIDGYVIDIHSDGSIGVGYYQNGCFCTTPRKGVFQNLRADGQINQNIEL